MPTAFDRFTPKNDHSPLANLLDFNDLSGLLDTTAENAGGMIRDFMQGLINGIVQTIKDLTGLDLSAVSTAFADLDFSSPTAFLESLITALLDLGALPGGLIPGLDASQIISGVFASPFLQPFIDAISSGFGGGSGLDYTGLESLLLAIPGVGPLIDTFVHTFLGLGGSGYGIADLLRAIQSIPANLVNGTLLPGMLSHLNIGSLSSFLPEFLVNPNFDSPNSLIGQGLWTWDGTQGPPGVSTSVFIDAAGVLRELFSNLIAVTAGQVLNISGKTKWTGFSGAANSIALTIAKFDSSHTLIGYDTHDAVASPGTNSAGWVTLGSPYTVPAGVASIFVRPTVTPTATSGRVWFGQFSAKPTATALGNPLVPLLDASKIGSGTFATGFVPDLGNLIDGVTNTLVGLTGIFSGTSVPQANSSMNSLYNSVLNNTQKLQANSAVMAAGSFSGTSVSIDFSNYPDGPLPSIFTTTYSGAGSSQLAIIKGNAGWSIVNDANRAAISIYNVAPTNSDFQLVRGSMASAPGGSVAGGQPRIWAVARVDNPANPQNYLWARAYCTGFLTYKCDLGCTVAGVDTVFLSNIPLTWAMDISIAAGAGGNPRRYQVFSGTTLIADYTEAGTTSQLGAGFRYWGAKTEMKVNNGNPGTIAGTAVSDNAPPNVLGSTFRVHRVNTAGVTAASAAVTKLPNNFFDTQDWISSDMTWDGQNLTVNTEGTYVCNLRMNTTNMPGGSKANGAIFQNNVAVAQVGGAFCDASVGANSPNGIFGLTLLYVHAGDVINPGYIVSANSTLSGDANGQTSYFGMALVNRSFL